MPALASARACSTAEGRMAQTNPSRIDTPTRLSAVVCLLVLVWIVTYWLWQPRRAGGAARPPITFAEPAGPVGPPAPGPEIRPDPAPSVTEPADDPLNTPAGPQVQPPTFTEYVVREGDVSMEIISQRCYGTSEHAAAILRANPFVDPTRLVPGRTRLQIPTDPSNVQGRVIAAGPADEPDGGDPSAGGAGPAPDQPAAPSTAARVVEYTITRQDTLWDIAEAYYGKGHLWRKIYDANRDVITDPDRPPVGKTIRIPPLE